MDRLTALPVVLSVIVSPILAFAGEAQPEIVTPPHPSDWLTGAKPTVDIRPRYEYGDEEGRDTSHAGTVRSRLGLLSGTYAGVQFFAEYEGTVTADRTSYQAASVHGLGQNKTIIADPESHELNQLWLSFQDWLPMSTVKVGRQAINLDNQRYVGTVAWRQNMQTFDAVTIHAKPMDRLTMTYGYINHVNRIFGSGDIANPAQTDFEGNSHLLNLAIEDPFAFASKLVIYGYFFDLGNDAGDVNSNQSFGFSLTGPLFDEFLTYYAEYGYQTDAFDSPLDYGANYFHVTASNDSVLPIPVLVGYEYLGSDNGVGYKFPLATGHKFNGFADKFLATPGAGLQDAYVSTSADLPLELKGSLFYHKFFAADGGADFGDEVDVVLVRKLSENITLLSKYAYFWSDGALTDIHRATIEMNITF